MNKKVLLYVFIFLIAMIGLYVITSKASDLVAEPASKTSPSAKAADESSYWSRLFRSVNDLSYNILFGWWNK